MSWLLANTAVALTRGTIRIDRFNTALERYSEEVAIPSVVGVEYEQVHQRDGELCAVIWLRVSAGYRVAFDQQIEGSLEARARRLAADLGQPITVPRMDDPPAADASE